MNQNHSKKNELGNHHSIKIANDYVKKPKQSQTFKDLSILFYTQQISSIIKSYQRGNFMGIMLLLIYYSQLASMLFEENVIKSITDSDINQRSFLFQVAQYIRCARIYTTHEVIAERSENVYSRSNDNESSNNTDEVEIAQSQINFSIFGVSYNLFVILYIMIQYILWMMSNNYQTSSKNESSIQEQLINDVVKKKFNLQNQSFMKKFFKSNEPLNKFISIMLQTYRYMFTIPFSVVSFSMIFNTNSYLNDQLAQEFRILLGVSLFLSTFIINLLIITNDFDYSIRYRDFFGSRVNNFRWICFCLDLLASYCCIQQQDSMNIKLYLWLHILQSLLRLAILIYEFPFFFELAQSCHFQGSFGYLLISILEIFSIQESYKISFSFLLLSLIPINYQISSMALRWRESFYTAFVSEKNIQNITAFHLEYYMRKVLIPLCQLDIEQYISKKFGGQGVKYESIYTQHIIYCQVRGQQDQNLDQDKIKNVEKKQQKQNSEEFQCFCQKYQFSELNLNNMNGHQHRKQFIVEYIYYLLNLSFNKNFHGQHNYEQRLTKKNLPQSVQFLKKIKPTYIYYLIQVASSPAKAYTEVFTIKQKYNQMTIQEQYTIELTIQDLKNEFLSFFDHSIYQNQRLRIGDVYQFDHAYRESFSELSKGLKIKQEFFQFLNQDSIILEELVKKSQKTVIQIQAIEDSLISLFKMNPLHQRTLQLSSIFLSHFDFKKRTLTSLILQATYQNELENPHQIRNDSEKVDLKINLFHQKSAAAFFLSLQNKTILRSSDSFSQLFGVNGSDMIGKPISLLFPDYYFPHISSYIERLVEESNIDLIKIGLYNTFIRTAKESLNPVVMRVKLDFLNEQTFGLSCYMQRIENDKFYIICDSNFMFLDASSQLKTLLLKNFQQNKKRKNTEELLQKVNVRNFIPILYGIDKFQELNQFDEKSKVSQNYERQTNFQQFNSILFLPTNKSQLNMVQKQVKQEIYDVSQYFKEFKPSEFDSVQVTFSPIVQKSFCEVQKCFNIIQISKIKKFKKIHEINEHLDQVREKFQKYFSHPVDIQEYENTSKDNSFIKDIQNYTTQETYFKIDNQQSETKDKEDTQNNGKPEVNTLQEIDYFESNYLHESNKKDKLTENQINNSLMEKQSSKYSDKANGQSNEDPQQIQNEIQDLQQDYYENYQAALCQNEYSLWPMGQKDISYGLENQYYLENQMMRENGEHINNLQSDNYLGNQIQNKNEANQSDFINSSEQKNNQQFQKKLQKLIIKSPRASNINVISIEDEHKYQNFASPKFGQELISPLSTHKDNEESQRYFVKNSPNRDNFQNSQSASHLVNGSLFSPTIKINEMYQESTIDDKQSNKTQIIHPQSFHISKNNEKLLQLQPLSIDQYSVSHTSIEQEIKNNIQLGHKSILLKNQTNRQLSRKEIQTLERNVTKLYNAQHTKSYKYDGEEDERGERRDQYSQFKKISDLGVQESEHSKREEKTGFQNNESFKKMFDSQLYFKRQFLCDMVTKRSELIQVKYAKNIGLFFLLLLVAISIGLYLTLINYFNNGWDYFKDMLIGYDILENYSQVIRQKELLFTLQVYGIPGYDINNQTQIQLETQERDYRQIQLRQLIDYFITNCVNKGFEQYMLQEQIQVSFLKNQNLPMVHLNFTRMYSLLNIPLYLWDYVSTNNLDSQTYVLEYYYNMMDMIAYIVNISSTTSYNKIQSSENLLYLSIALIELFCLLLIMLVFPIYYIVQSKREEILKLLATFDSNFLEKIIQKCNIELLENKQNFGSSKTLRSIKTNKNVSSKNILSQTQILSGYNFASSQFKKSNKKRKAVSQTNNLQKYSFSIMIYSLLMFIILSIYSITNYFLTRNFFQTFNYNIQEISQIYQIKALISLELSTIQLFTNSFMYQFTERDISVLKQFKEQILDQQLQQRIASLYQVDQDFQIDREDMQEYKQYYLKTIKEDACQILFDKYNIQFTDQKAQVNSEINETFDSKVDPSQCINILNGKLKQGLTVTLKELISEFNQLYLAFTSTNDEQEYVQLFELWCQVIAQDNKVNLLYSPFYLNEYTLSSNEGTSQLVKVAANIQAVYLSSGFGGLLVLDKLGGTKLLQQNFSKQYVSQFDVSRNGDILILAFNSTLAIFQYPEASINLQNMQNYQLISSAPFQSEIIEIIYFEAKSLIFVSGLQGCIAVYDSSNLQNLRILDTYQTESVQITAIWVSNDAQWIYLSCDIEGIIVLKLNFISNSNSRQANFTKAAYGNGYRKTWSLVVTNDNKYIYEIENWFGIFYADNSQTLAANSSTLPIQLTFKAYWPFQYINPVCTIILISNDNNFIFVGVRSLGILIFDISQRENIQFFQHIQIDGLSNSAVLSGDEKFLYYANSLSLKTFKQSAPNLNNNFPNIFNTHQAIQKQMEGIYKWRCYIDPSNQYLMGSFDYSGTYMIPFYNNPLNLQIQYATHMQIESDSMSFDTKNNLLFIPSLYSNKLISVFSIQPTNTDPSISLTNPKEINSFSVNTFQMAEQLIFSKDRSYAIQTYQIGIMLFNMTDPFKISLVYYYQSPDFMQGETGGGAITDDNNYIIACCRNYGIYVLDCVDKSNIYLSDYLETLGAESITLSKISSNYGYLMDGIRGFAVLDLTALPKIKILSRINISGWTQLGIPIKEEKYILIGSQDIGMLTLVDIQDKTNPILIATYTRDKQFSVAICTTVDENYVFITNPQGIITMPLKSQVYIHTEVSIINVDQLTGNQSISQYQMQQGQSNYIFQVGQQVQLNFLILYPQNEDERIIEVNQYLNGQVTPLPFYMEYQQNTQTLTMQIDKSALGSIRQGMNQNILLMKTVIPLYINQFEYTLQDPNDIVSTDSAQASLILNYLVDQNYLDSKQTITDFFDSTKSFKFNNDFIINFQNLQSSSQIQNLSLFIQQLEQKVLQTLILSYFINPVVYFVEPSLSLNFTNSNGYIQSLSTSLISFYIQVDQKIGKFIIMNYPGVITSFSQTGDQIKLEGSLSNINDVLQRQIIFANSTEITSEMEVQLQLIDNYNYPFVLNTNILECPLIVLKQQIKVQNPLQKQVEKQYQDSIVDIQQQITLTFAQNSFVVNDTQQIIYKIQIFNPSSESYEDLTPDFWLQSQGDTRLNYFGTIPSKYFNTIFRFKIIANDTYTVIEDFFILKAYGVPFLYIFNLLVQVLGPLLAILGIYNKRAIIWNILYQNKTRFEDEHAYVGEQFNMKIILMGDVLKDSILVVDKLLKKINECEKNQNQDKLKTEIMLDDQAQTQQTETDRNKNKYIFQNNSIMKSVKRVIKISKLIPKADIDKMIKGLASFANHKRNQIIEKKYMQKSGNVLMEEIIQDILKYNLISSISKNQKKDDEVIKELKDNHSRIHKAIHQNISRRLLQLDKRSLKVYDTIKECAIKYFSKQKKYWYRAFIDFDSSTYFKESKSQEIFSSLIIKVQELSDLFLLLKLLPPSAHKEIQDFNSLVESLQKYKTGINMYLIRDCLYADAYGLISKFPSLFYLAQGESIHMHQHQIKQIQAFKKQVGPSFYNKCCSLFNLEYKTYGVSKNIRLPTWISLDQKHGVILIQGVPSVEDMEEVLIRIYDHTGYVVKSFVLKVTYNPNEKSAIEQSIPEENQQLTDIYQDFQDYNQNFITNSMQNKRKSFFIYGSRQKNATFNNYSVSSQNIYLQNQFSKQTNQNKDENKNLENKSIQKLYPSIQSYQFFSQANTKNVSPCNKLISDQNTQISTINDYDQKLESKQENQVETPSQEKSIKHLQKYKINFFNRTNSIDIQNFNTQSDFIIEN
ncbi:hypothetical protein ABPG74_015117 [Tetrahymena malaccensis]